MSRSGVLRYCSIAFVISAVLMFPAELMWVLRSRFAVLTPTSALVLAWGNPTEDTL